MLSTEPAWIYICVSIILACCIKLQLDLNANKNIHLLFDTYPKQKSVYLICWWWITTFIKSYHHKCFLIKFGISELCTEKVCYPYACSIQSCVMAVIINVGSVKTVLRKRTRSNIWHKVGSRDDFGTARCIGAEMVTFKSSNLSLNIPYR